MSDACLWLDGNGIAGLLVEAFGTEMTTAQRACQSCRARNPVGAHRAYRGAGMVLRCPACGDVGLQLVVLPDRHVVKLMGSWTLDVPRS
jgi:hypothetical protein